MTIFLRLLPILAVITFSSNVLSEEYLLEFNQQCSSDGNELKYSCDKPIDPKHYIYKESGLWKARTLNGTQQASFKVLREDENILILEHTTLYSGNQTIFIMKQNNQFYLIQVAYSDILENNETTTKQGIYFKTK